MDKRKYFERIGFDADTEVTHTYEFLKKFQEAHVYSVPYENIDAVEGKPISLNLEDIYEKVVNKHRGGWCFELNCLVHHFLSELGFNTVSYFARFWRGETGVPIYRHRVVAVFLDGETYIIDVGIGAVAPRIPLILKEGIIQEYFGESYRFERDGEFGWVLYELRHGEWQKYFSFFEQKHYDNDFVAISYFCETHSASKFNKSLMVAMKNEKGRKTLDGRTYKEFVGTSLTHIEENISDERLVEVLKNEFGVIR